MTRVEEWPASGHAVERSLELKSGGPMSRIAEQSVSLLM